MIRPFFNLCRSKGPHRDIRYAGTLCSQSNAERAAVLKEVPASKHRWVPAHGSYPQGFAASGTSVGVKAALNGTSDTSRRDLALIVSSRPCTAAAVFTTNRICAAPVRVSQQTLQVSKGIDLRAVVINAGCANAVTGQAGMDAATAMGRCVDELLTGVSHQTPVKTLVMSTGVIGQRLPIDRILEGIPKGVETMANTHAAWLATAQAICTTDTFPKLQSTTFTLPSAPDITYRLAGITKGAGMIHPNMATLLGVICTDAPLAVPVAQHTLRQAMLQSFNAISIDGDTSTNDTVALLANGAAGGPSVDRLESGDAAAFTAVLNKFAQELAHLVVRDGEGATKFVEIRVADAVSASVARQLASSVARSPLVKTALYGKDANWGRILAAIGATSGHEVREAIHPDRISVSFVPNDGSASLQLLVDGAPVSFDESRAAEILSAEDLLIEVNMGNGQEQASYWTCDLSHDYVSINADYRT